MARREGPAYQRSASEYPTKRVIRIWKPGAEAPAVVTSGEKYETMENIRLILADVDGTLVTHEKVFTARALDAVRKMDQAGIAFAITSGRPPRGMQMLIERYL